MTYVVFDLLYASFECLLDERLESRRERLRELVARTGEPQLVFSDGVVGRGRAFFEEASSRGLEGVVAKKRSSRYLPGKRSSSWLKIKPVRTLVCAVIGFVPGAGGDFKSLIVAALEDGELRPVGRVGSGFSEAQRGRLKDLLFQRRRSQPLVPCSFAGKWVEPGLYCKVTYLELTRAGQLRGPVFQELLVEDS